MIPQLKNNVTKPKAVADEDPANSDAQPGRSASDVGERPSEFRGFSALGPGVWIPCDSRASSVQETNRQTQRIAPIAQGFLRAMSRGSGRFPIKTERATTRAAVGGLWRL